jgi:hypothetical protein
MKKKKKLTKGQEDGEGLKESNIDGVVGQSNYIHECKYHNETPLCN